MPNSTPKSSGGNRKSSKDQDKGIKTIGRWPQYYDYAGAIHIHSDYSDGTGSIPHIATIAREVGLDYLIITDHDTLRGLEEGQEGWYGNTLLLVGEEVSSPLYKGYNHYMALGHEKHLPRGERRDLESSLNKIREGGGISFIAHPFSRGNWRFARGPLPWRAWNIDGYTGMEIWSYMHDWFESLSWSNFLDLWRNPHKATIAPRPEDMALWDRESLKRRVVGIGGTDIHAKRLLWSPELLPYGYAFRTVRTHILTPAPFLYNLKQDRKSLYETLREGHCYFAYDLLCNSTGFIFSAVNGRHKVIMGDEITFAPDNDIVLKVSSPAKAKIRLIRNGELIRQVESDYLRESIIDAGVYRIEAYYQGKPWVYTNPIYVRPYDYDHPTAESKEGEMLDQLK